MWMGSPAALGTEEELGATVSSGLCSQCLITVFSLLQSLPPQSASDSSWARRMTAQHPLSSSPSWMSCCPWMGRRWSGRRPQGEPWPIVCSTYLWKQVWGKRVESVSEHLSLTLAFCKTGEHDVGWVKESNNCFSFLLHWHGCRRPFISLLEHCFMDPYCYNFNLNKELVVNLHSYAI